MRSWDRVELDGVATLTGLDDTDRLDVTMAGPFQWRRLQQEDVLLEAVIRGHLLQLYVTSAQIRTTGTWLGKRVLEDENAEK